MTAEYPSVADLLPHTGDMVLLSQVLEHNESGTACTVEVAAGPLVESDGRVGAWIGIEYMAQCIAAHGSLMAFEAGEAPRIGLLLGSRRVRLLRGHYEIGQRLIARATRVWGRREGLVAFECSLECANTGELVADGRLNCFLMQEGQLEMTEELE
jgi:predicted hotdog family 3-hydroxylacyl-ACP dehydratase